MQRLINEYPAEPLTAILPGVTLQEVWEIAGAAEKTLFAVSVLVVVVGLAGMLVALLTSLSERRREMAVLRSVGARPTHVFALDPRARRRCSPWRASRWASPPCTWACSPATPGWSRAWDCSSAWAGRRPTSSGSWPWWRPPACCIGLIPAYRIYRYSLADGMTIRV